MRTRPVTLAPNTVASSSSVDSSNGARPSARPALLTRIVEAAEPLDGLRDEAPATRRVGHVERERDLRLEPFDAARTARDAHARGRELGRRRAADAGRRAGHDRPLAGQLWRWHDREAYARNRDRASAVFRARPATQPRSGGREG